jgi:hypothetical protein
MIGFYISTQTPPNPYERKEEFERHPGYPDFCQLLNYSVRPGPQNLRQPPDCGNCTLRDHLRYRSRFIPRGPVAALADVWSTVLGGVQTKKKRFTWNPLPLSRGWRQGRRPPGIHVKRFLLLHPRRQAQTNVLTAFDPGQVF